MMLKKILQKISITKLNYWHNSNNNIQIRLNGLSFFILLSIIMLLFCLDTIHIIDVIISSKEIVNRCAFDPIVFSKEEIVSNLFDDLSLT